MKISWILSAAATLFWIKWVYESVIHHEYPVDDAVFAIVFGVLLVVFVQMLVTKFLLRKTKE